jgi:HD-like signal output (HDOD) protein
MSSALEYWVDMLREVRLPVLARTVTELEQLRCGEADATPQRIAQVVLHDPIMTVRVLQYLQQHRNRLRTTDITTIAHALMMLGTTPFFAFFVEQSSIEDRLAGAGVALRGVREVMSRARHAALYAYDWARMRHDTDPEEIMVAALLHDLAEMVLWCFAPVLALEIAERQQLDRTLRSEDAQLDVIGFRLIDLQLELIKAWQLPALLQVLMDKTRIRNPRVQNVTLAAAVAGPKAPFGARLGKSGAASRL